MGSAFDLLLAGLVIAVAIWVISVRDSFAAVVAFVGYGLLLALVWVRIAAPDVALTEAAIGSGVIGSLLLSATVRFQRAERFGAIGRPGKLLRASATGLCIIVAVALAAVVLFLPKPPPTLAPTAVTSLPATGLDNPVAAVLIVYRAVDTLLEAVVLVLVTLGVWSLAPDRLWGGLPGQKAILDPDSTLTLLARCLLPVGIIIGLYIFWVGSQAPGGEFQASAILGAMWILALMSGLADAPSIGRRWLRAVIVIGPIVFMATGFAGFGLAGGFLAYPARFIKPIIVVIEVTLMVSIATMLGLLVAGPPRRRKRP